MRLGTFIVGLSFLISKILGLVRDNLLASTFGAGTTKFCEIVFCNPAADLNTYYAAFRLPDFLFNLLSYGVLSAAFVPLFAEYVKKEGKEKAFEFTNDVLHAFSFLMVIISGILFLFAPYIMKLIVPGFSPGELQVTITLTRIMLVTPVLFTISSIASGVQNALHTFVGLSLAPIIYNIGIICGIVFFSDAYGVYGVAFGVVVGSILNVLVQIPSLVQHGFRLKLRFRFWSSRIADMVKLALPRIFGMSVSQLSLVVDTIIASGLLPGSIAIINFSSNLESLPMGLIAITVSIVSFGTLSGFAAENNRESFVLELSNSLHRILFLLMPITLGMFLLRFQLVRILLGRGKFNWTDTILTANTLGVFITGLAFGGIVFVLARAFYAQKDTKTPVVIGLIAVALNIIFSIVLTRVVALNTYGLALANSTADILNASLLLIFLRKKLRHGILDSGEVAKYLVATLGMAVVVQVTKNAFGNIFEDINTYAEIVIQTGASILVGVLTYFAGCALLKSNTFIAVLPSRLRHLLYKNPAPSVSPPPQK